MEFEKLLEERKSIRAYKDTPVPASALESIAKSVQLSPTACNRQPFKVTVYLNPAQRAAICSVYTAPWLKQAPSIAVVCGCAAEGWVRPEGNSIIDVDCAIVMEHFVLAAANEGLGTCWICAFERAKLASALKLDEKWSPVAITPLGYAAENPIRRTRKASNEIFEVVK